MHFHLLNYKTTSVSFHDIDYIFNTFRATNNGALPTKPIKKADKLAKAAEGSRSITEFFPIRRSERKKKSEIEKDWMEGIEARLLATDDTDLDLEV